MRKCLDESLEKLATHSLHTNQAIQLLRFQQQHTLPIGSVVLWCGPPIDEDHPLPGFAECNGTALNPNTHPALFDLLDPAAPSQTSPSASAMPTSVRRRALQEPSHFHVPDLQNLLHVRNDSHASVSSGVSPVATIEARAHECPHTTQLLDAQETIARLLTRSAHFERHIALLEKRVLNLESSSLMARPGAPAPLAALSGGGVAPSDTSATQPDVSSCSSSATSIDDGHHERVTAAASCRSLAGSKCLGGPANGTFQLRYIVRSTGVVPRHHDLEDVPEFRSH